MELLEKKSPFKEKDLRKYKPNDNFFDDINSFGLKQSFILGWILTDAWHDVKRKRIALKLQERDKPILEKMKNVLEFDGPITLLYRPPSSILGGPIKKYQDRSCLHIQSSKISSFLDKHGFNNSKSISTGFPNFLNKKYWPQFILSCFDGDGTFSFCRKTNKFEFNIVGNSIFLKDLEEILFKQLGIEAYYAKRIFNNGSKTLRFCGNDNALKFFNYVYKDSEYFLERKFLKFKELVEYKNTIIHKDSRIEKLLKESNQIIEFHEKKNRITD